jgi:hypothetical protein
LTALERIVLGCGNFGGIGSDLSLVGLGEREAEASGSWMRRGLGASAVRQRRPMEGGRSETTIGEWLRERRPDGL